MPTGVVLVRASVLVILVMSSLAKVGPSIVLAPAISMIHFDGQVTEHPKNREVMGLVLTTIHGDSYVPVVLCGSRLLPGDGWTARLDPKEKARPGAISQ